MKIQSNISFDSAAKKCIICGNHLSGRQTKFCSATCRWKDHECNRKKIQKVCMHCGKDYFTSNKEQKYCSLSCTASATNLGRKGEDARNWKGGRRQRKDGYVLLYAPEHPMSHKDGYVYEHRLIEKDKFPFTLPSTMPVHHKNGDKSDNSPENTQALRSQSSHMKLHHGNKDWNSV